MDCTNDTVSTGHLSAVAGDHIHTEVADAFTITSLVGTAPDGFATNGAAVSQNQQQPTRETTPIATDKFYPTA